MSDPQSTTVLVISAGMGLPSSTQLLGQRMGEAVAEALGTSAVEVRHVELRTLASDLAKMLTSRIPSPALAEVFDAVGRAAGVVAVTPVYNGGPSGLFKMFFDLMDEDVLAGRPVLMGATGGTVRHSLVIDHSMLPMFHYLKARVAPLSVFAATSDWGSGESGLSRRIEKSAQAMVALMAACPATPRRDEFADVPSLEELLGGGTVY